MHANARRGWLFVASIAVGMPVVAQIQGIPVTSTQISFGWPSTSHDGDTIHVGFTEDTYPTVGRYLRSADRGRTWSVPVTLGTTVDAIASAGRRVYVFGGPSCWRSADGGLTWQSGPSPAGGPVRTVHAAGLECHVLAGSNTVYARTLDGGATWSAMRSFGTLAHPAHMIVDGSTVHVFWTWSVGGNASTYYDRSTDSGTTWLPSPRQIGTAGALRRDQVAVSGSFLHLLRGSNPVEYWRSPDAGNSWLSMAPLAAALTYEPRLAVAGRSVYVMLHGPALGQSGLVVMRSGDDGATWAGTSISAAWPLTMSIAANGSVVCAAWSQASTVRTIATSIDAGQTWSSTPAGTPSGQMSERGSPVVSIRPPAISVLWLRVDLMMGLAYWWHPTDLDVSGDLGATWHLHQALGWGPAGFVDGPDATAVLWCSQLGSSTSQLTALRYGTIYGHERFGPGKPGTGGIAPTVRLQGTPHLASNMVVTVADIVGGATTVLGASFAGEANTPLASGVLLLAPPTIGWWGLASGAQGLAGAGSWQSPFTIPNSPSLHQQRVSFQGFALDSDAADGFSSTAGLTMMVL